MPEFFTEDEKRIVHPDGWLFFVRDGDEGTIEFGYREWSEVSKTYVDFIKPVVIMSNAASQLAEAFLFFHDRDKRKKESVEF